RDLVAAEVEADARHPTPVAAARPPVHISGVPPDAGVADVRYVRGRAAVVDAHAGDASAVTCTPAGRARRVVAHAHSGDRQRVAGVIDAAAGDAAPVAAAIYTYDAAVHGDVCDGEVVTVVVDAAAGDASAVPGAV